MPDLFEGLRMNGVPILWDDPEDAAHPHVYFYLGGCYEVPGRTQTSNVPTETETGIESSDEPVRPSDA